MRPERPRVAARCGATGSLDPPPYPWSGRPNAPRRGSPRRYVRRQTRRTHCARRLRRSWGPKSPARCGLQRRSARRRARWGRWTEPLTPRAEPAAAARCRLPNGSRSSGARGLHRLGAPVLPAGALPAATWRRKASRPEHRTPGRPRRERGPGRWEPSIERPSSLGPPCVPWTRGGRSLAPRAQWATCPVRPRYERRGPKPGSHRSRRAWSDGLECPGSQRRSWTEPRRVRRIAWGRPRHRGRAGGSCQPPSRLLAQIERRSQPTQSPRRLDLRWPRRRAIHRTHWRSGRSRSEPRSGPEPEPLAAPRSDARPRCGHPRTATRARIRSSVPSHRWRAPHRSLLRSPRRCEARSVHPARSGSAQPRPRSSGGRRLRRRACRGPCCAPRSMSCCLPGRPGGSWRHARPGPLRTGWSWPRRGPRRSACERCGRSGRWTRWSHRATATLRRPRPA